MAHCTNCGAELKSAAKFCPSCGTPAPKDIPAVCSGCGAPLKPGAKFCAACGTPTVAASAAVAGAGTKPAGAAPKVSDPPPPPAPKEQPAQAAAAPKNIKEGEVFKCPQCGQVVNAFDTKCSACGHEFRNRSAAKSVTVFFEEYKKAALATRAAIVRGFPLPNTREDILSFLTLGIGNTKTITDEEAKTYRQGGGFSEKLGYRKEEIAAWQAKIEQAVAMGKIILSDAGDIALLHQYEQQLKINENISGKARFKKRLVLSAVAAAALIIIVIVVYGNLVGFTKVPKTVTVSAKDIEISGTHAKFVKVVEKDYVVTSSIETKDFFDSWGRATITIQFELVADIKADLAEKVEKGKISLGWQNARTSATLNGDLISMKLYALDAANGELAELGIQNLFDFERLILTAELGDILTVSFETSYYEYRNTLAEVKKSMAELMAMQSFRINGFSPSRLRLENEGSGSAKIISW
jgi:predicted RNA-binding Zn-ribbon protein involved in translation (DUF1610 family)